MEIQNTVVIYESWPVKSNSATDNKVEQNKGQYDLDRQTAKISDLSSGNVGKYEFLTYENLLPEIGLLERYSP